MRELVGRHPEVGRQRLCGERDLLVAVQDHVGAGKRGER
jgi:hypothetical protein